MKSKDLTSRDKTKRERGKKELVTTKKKRKRSRNIKRGKSFQVAEDTTKTNLQPF